MKKLPVYYKHTFENAPEKICIINEEHEVLFTNRSFIRFIEPIDKNESENLAGMDFFEMLRKCMQKDELIISGIKNGFQQIEKKQDTCFTYEFPFYTRNMCYWIMFVACRQKDDEAGINIIITKFYDVTDHHNRRKFENKKDDNNIVRQIIGESMHTWRQPLNTISLFVQDIKEQFDDNTLTKYYMNFSSRQITSEIRRLSVSIDEMADFYTNDTLEDTINVSETMFSTIKKVHSIMTASGIAAEIDCHAIGNIPTESFIGITDSFKVRCGTGAKKCFQGCNKGNIVVYGDRVLFNYIIRMLLTLGKDIHPEKEKLVHFDLSIEDNLFVIVATFSFDLEDSETLDFLKDLFDRNFKGIFYTSHADGEMKVEMNFQEYKTKNPI